MHSAVGCRQGYTRCSRYGAAKTVARIAGEVNRNQHDGRAREGRRTLAREVVRREIRRRRSAALEHDGLQRRIEKYHLQAVYRRCSADDDRVGRRVDAHSVDEHVTIRRKRRHRVQRTRVELGIGEAHGDLVCAGRWRLTRIKDSADGRQRREERVWRLDVEVAVHEVCRLERREISVRVVARDVIPNESGLDHSGGIERGYHRRIVTRGEHNRLRRNHLTGPNDHGAQELLVLYDTVVQQLETHFYFAIWPEIIGGESVDARREIELNREILRCRCHRKRAVEQRVQRLFRVGDERRDGYADLLAGRAVLELHFHGHRAGARTNGCVFHASGHQ